jgi:hypothetical protein
MRADMTAAYFDYETTGKLATAIERGEAPPATATRMFNGRRVPVWARAECDLFIQRRHDANFVVPTACNDNNASFNAAELI